MVATVLADARPMREASDAKLRQALPVSDPRQLQQLRALYRAGAHDHLARGARKKLPLSAAVGDADGASLVDLDAGRAGAGCHDEGAAAACGIEVGFTSAPTPSPFRVALQVTDTLIGNAAVVGGGRHPGRNAGRMKGPGQRAAAGTADVDVATVHAHGATALGIGFHALEEGHDMGISPAGIAELTPMIELGGLAAHPLHAVDAGRAAQHAPAWPERPAPAKVRLRFRIKAPQAALRQEHETGAQRNLEPKPWIILARLEQKHAKAPAFAEPTGDGTARRTCPDHDIVPGRRVGRQGAHRLLHRQTGRAPAHYSLTPPAARPRTR